MIEYICVMAMMYDLGVIFVDLWPWLLDWKIVLGLLLHDLKE